MKNILIFFFLSAIISSCTIVQEYHFKKDFSGTVSNKIDMDAAMTMIKSMDTTGAMKNFSDSINYAFEKVKTIFVEKGATNFKFNFDKEKSVLNYSFDFKNIDVLNKTIQDTGNVMYSALKQRYTTPPYFKKNGKKGLIYYKGSIKQDTAMNSMDNNMYKNMIKYELKFSFDRKITKVTDKTFEVADDKKSAKASINIFDFAKSEEKIIEFKLK